MSSRTTKLGLITWNDTDYVNFDDMNDNFNKIDSLVNCTKSEVKNASYTGGSQENAEWYCKTYTDGIMEVSAVLYFTNLKCNGGDEAPYYSGNVTVNLPVTFTHVYNLQLHLSSNTHGWISDITNDTITDKVEFIALNMIKETDAMYKQVFVTVKGRID